MRLAFKVAIVAVVLAAVLLLVSFYITNALGGIQRPAGPVAQALGIVSVNANAGSEYSLSYANGTAPLLYSLVSYSELNATLVSVGFSVYAKNPVERIFLLNVSNYCVSCYSEQDLQSGLQAYLAGYDLIRNSTSFAMVNASALGSLPSGSIVIIPSGLIPDYLINGTDPELADLLAKGDTVVYAGRDFNSSMGPNGLIFLTPAATLGELASLSLATGRLNASTPVPVGAANLTFANPEFKFLYGTSNGNLTYVQSLNGTMVAFPNYPKDGWGSAAAEAKDIASAINDSFWIRGLGRSTIYLLTNGDASGTIGAFANITGASASGINGTYSVISVLASNRNSLGMRKLVLQNTYAQNGTVSLPSQVGVTQQVPVSMRVTNTTAQLLLHLDVYNRNMSYVGSIPVGFVSNEAGVVKYHTFGLPGGYYVLQLRDFNDRYYGGAVLYVAPVNITPVSLNFNNGTFVFSAYSNGIALSNVSYSASLNGLYSSTGTVSDGILSYSLPGGAPISYGSETFSFGMLGTVYSYGTSYTKQVLNIPAIYIEFGIAVVVVILINLLLKPPNRDEYYIDVPDFPPGAREKVRVQKSALLSVFDKVNYYHGWKYMPLTVDEIKLGIAGNIRSGNMPVSVTTRNLEGALASLEQSDSIMSASGCYAPAVWAAASGHGIEYLAVFRRLRDYCVSHAILFTDIDADEHSDMLMTKSGTQVSAYIYAHGERMKKVGISRDARSVIIFASDDAAREFERKLYASTSKQAELLKLGIEYSYLRLMDVNSLDQLAF